MSNVEDGVVRILGHSSWRTFACWVFSYYLASGCIGVSKKAAVLNASQKEMVWKKLKMGSFNVFAKTMNLNSSMIVDVGVLLLGDCEILVVV